jgi:hypothetical protein
LQRNCLATSLGAYRYNNRLPIVVTSFRGKVFNDRVIETQFFLCYFVFVAARIFTESLPSNDDIPLLLQKRQFLYCCRRLLLSNGCFCGSTVLAWSKYVTIFSCFLHLCHQQCQHSGVLQTCELGIRLFIFSLVKYLLQ